MSDRLQQSQDDKTLHSLCASIFSDEELAEIARQLAWPQPSRETEVAVMRVMIPCVMPYTGEEDPVKAQPSTVHLPLSPPTIFFCQTNPFFTLVQQPDVMTQALFVAPSATRGTHHAPITCRGSNVQFRPGTTRPVALVRRL